MSSSWVVPTDWPCRQALGGRAWGGWPAGGGGRAWGGRALAHNYSSASIATRINNEIMISWGSNGAPVELQWGEMGEKYATFGHSLGHLYGKLIQIIGLKAPGIYFSILVQ